MIYDREYRFIVPQEIYQLNNVVRAASLPPSCATPWYRRYLYEALGLCGPKAALVSDLAYPDRGRPSFWSGKIFRRG
jgi:hypothetical protein